MEVINVYYHACCNSFTKKGVWCVLYMYDGKSFVEYGTLEDTDAVRHHIVIVDSILSFLEEASLNTIKEVRIFTSLHGFFTSSSSNQNKALKSPSGNVARSIRRIHDRVRSLCTYNTAVKLVHLNAKIDPLNYFHLSHHKMVKDTAKNIFSHSYDVRLNCSLSKTNQVRLSS